MRPFLPLRVTQWVTQKFYRVFATDVVKNTILTVAGPVSRDQKSPIIAFVTDPKFQVLYGGLDRFLAMLSWLNDCHPEKFAELPSMSFGSRNYFGRSEREILDTAPGTKAKQIPNSEFWVLVTFSNDDKKKLLRRVIRFLGYSGTDTERALQEFPDSKKRQEFDFGDMLRQGKFVVWGSESDYDELESALVSAGVTYKRSKREQFSIDPTAATIITIMVTTSIRAVAYVLTTYLKERKRKIIVTKTLDGSVLTPFDSSRADFDSKTQIS
jgi:negative regulator of replication initiation